MAAKRKATEVVMQPEKRNMLARRKGIERVKDFLREKTLGEFLKQRPPRQVVTFDVGTTIGDALQQLHTCNILSAPLFDATHGEYYGFVDRWDILQQVLKSIDLPNMHQDELVYHLKKLGDNVQAEKLSVMQSLEDGELIYKANESHSLYEVVRYGFNRTHGKQKDTESPFLTSTTVHAQTHRMR